MSKIKIFAIGGLDEVGKNMYVVEVEKQMFIFDAGLKIPEGQFGIDKIIPDFTYIEKNQEKIEGIFLTHGHFDAIGAMPELLELIPNLPVYGSNLTIEILKLLLEETVINATNLNVIKAHRKIDFGDVSIFPIQVSHSIPDALGFVINTSDGNIIYTGDFVFNPVAVGTYQTDIGKLAYIGKQQQVLCLLTDSTATDNLSHAGTFDHPEIFLEDIFATHNKRIIISTFSTNYYYIQEVMNQVALNHRKLIIVGKKFKNLVDRSIELKYLKFNKKLFGSINDINSDKAVILVGDDSIELFNTINKIAHDHDKLIKLKNTDAFVLFHPVLMGAEVMMASIMDLICKKGTKYYQLPKQYFNSYNASREDLLMMINLIQPKYLMPVRGEYRNQVASKEAALMFGMKENQIILVDNGDVVEFKDGKLMPIVDKVPVGDVLIDGINTDNLGDVVLKDREVLANGGIVVISVVLDKKTKKIISGPEVLTKGFVFLKDNQEIINDTQKLTKKVIEQNIKNNYIDYNEAKKEIRRVVGDYLYNKTKARPMIISITQEI